MEWGGHTFELESVDERINDNESKRVIAANVILDGADVYRPATTTYLNHGQDVGTPSVRTGLTEDIYLTLDPGAAAGDTSATIRVFVKPMILWLWIGGLIMAIGTLLAAFPGTRRRRADRPGVGAARDGDIDESDRRPAPSADAADRCRD